MDQTIKQELDKIAKKEQIQILYAVESGSRAWGFPSKDSDYDVRFIYTRPKKSYLQLQPTKDVLEYPISGDLDISGWDLDKTLKLLRKNNPALLEWLASPIIYKKNTSFYRELCLLSDKIQQPKGLIYHYLHMAKGNFRDYLKQEQVKSKKYFYVLRPLLACMWIEYYHEKPPVPFEQLLTIPSLSTDFLDAVAQLLIRKKAGEELALEEQIPEIQAFIKEKITYFESYVLTLETLPSIFYDELNDFFFKWIE